MGWNCSKNSTESGWVFWLVVCGVLLGGAFSVLTEGRQCLAPEGYSFYHLRVLMHVFLVP